MHKDVENPKPETRLGNDLHIFMDFQQRDVMTCHDYRGWEIPIAVGFCPTFTVDPPTFHMATEDQWSKPNRSWLP